MRYVSINSVPNGSTGAVMRQVTEERRALGDECWCMWGRGRAAENDYEFNFGKKPEFYLDVLQTRLDGKAGFHSGFATQRLIKKLEEIRPDIVHLHNIHGYYVNVEMLFAWLVRHKDVQVKWTLHDCWAFTGHCAHFTYVNCTQWKNRCAHFDACPQLNSYPKTYSNKSCGWNFDQKERIFTQLPSDRMTIITPSHWLEGLVRESFLSKYQVEVRHNTIDRTVFKPLQSDFRVRYGVGNRFLVLGVASPWTDKKGLYDFHQLWNDLDHRLFSIVLVGLNKKQRKELPQGMIGMGRTDSTTDLAKIYSAANVFFNPTKEDNFPTVNLEAEACGTIVITYDTGGCAETISLTDSCVLDGYDSCLRQIRLYGERMRH